MAFSYKNFCWSFFLIQVFHNQAQISQSLLSQNRLCLFHTCYITYYFIMYAISKCFSQIVRNILISRDVAAAPLTPQLGGPRPTLGAQVSLKLLFGYVTIFSSADLFTTDLNCRKKLACDIISEFYVTLSRRILNIRLTQQCRCYATIIEWSGILFGYKYRDNINTLQSADKVFY